MAKETLDLIPVAFRITKKQKEKLSDLAKVEKNSQSGIVRSMIESRKLKVRSDSVSEVITIKK